MTIYSWNMLYSNTRLDEALEFIRSGEFAVFSLQEVPGHFLETLRALPYHMISVREQEECGEHLVLLSRLRVQASGTVRLPDSEHGRSVFSRRLAALLRPLGIWRHNYGDRNALWADIEMEDGELVRVYNLHLPLLYPDIRAREFECTLLDHDASRRTVVCGDFNILERPHITPINWLLGGRARDSLFWRKERRGMQERFHARGLHNPHLGEITHPLSYSQLDHILVSKHCVVQNARVLRARHGSDHRPICADIALS